MRIISGISKGTHLNTLEGLNTRPTLDRVKESLFNIINNDIEDSIILDLFSGSGALGLEALSRGAKLAIFCDNSKEANKIIKQNILKTKMQDKAIVYLSDFKVAIQKLKNENIKPDIVFLDPPYKSNYILKSLELLVDSDILNESSIIIAETDDKQRVLKELENIELEIYDVRKYGRAYLIFLRL